MYHQLKPHGLMFHHFYDGRHPRGQGAIDGKTFRNMLINIGVERFLHPQEWVQRFKENSLAHGDLCITFDDTLLCQYEVAKEVLHELGLRAFFFVYTSVLSDGKDTLELYRYFRTVCYDDIDEFYSDFFTECARLRKHDTRTFLEGYDPAEYLKPYAYFSENDKKFRFLRDEILSVEEYDWVMTNLMCRSEFDSEKAKKILWMSEQHIKDLSDCGHEIGLHSHSHPMTMGRLPVSVQESEYNTNKSLIEEILNKKVCSMSHPSNSYNNDTLQVLNSIGIEIGFRADLEPLEQISNLELPRNDHTNVVTELEQ